MLRFEHPIDDTTLDLIKEEFGDPKFHDRRQMLFDDMPVINGSKMRDIVKAAKQTAVIEINSEGDIATMADGTRYRVTARGWQKIAGSGDV